MNRPGEQKKKRKRIILLLAALLITALFAGSVVFSIEAMGEAPPEASVSSVNEERSQLLVSGKNYSLEKEQEELYSSELEREEEIREEEKKEEQKEESYPEETAESIISEQEEQPEPTIIEEKPTQTPELSDEPTPEPTETPTPEPSIPQTPTPTPAETPTPDPSSSPTPTAVPTETETPTPAPDTKTPTPTPDPGTETPTPDPDDGDDGKHPGDDGTPEPSGGPDDGHDGDDDGEGDEGDNPTPSPSAEPTQPPEINTDPVIFCSLDDEGYTYGSRFTLKGNDYLGRLISSSNYSVWFDGNILYSSGTEGDYVSYRPTDYLTVSAGDHEIMVSITDDEGHSSSKTYSAYVESEEEQIDEAYVYITVAADQIYTSESFTLLYDQVQIYKDESVASLVDRTLRAWGFDPQTGDGADYYLARISKPGMIDMDQVKEEYRDLIFTTDSLGERDISHSSGWMYSVDGAIVDGMSKVTLYDNAEVYIWFDLSGVM